MPLYVYAIADRLTDSSALVGVADEPLVFVRAGNVLVASGWMPQVPAVDRERLSAQDRLVRELHARAEALLPLRFGTSVADEAELARKIEALKPELEEAIALVRGREQMTLRVLRGVSGESGASGESNASGALGASGASGASGVVRASSHGGVGTRYLQSRRAATVPPELTPLIDALTPLQRATRIERGRAESLIATIYHLIERGSSDAYRAAVTEATATVPLFTVRVTGPGPAYAFASLIPPSGT